MNSVCVLRNFECKYCDRLDYDTICSGCMVSTSVSEVHSVARRTVYMCLPNYTVSLPRRRNYKPSPPWIVLVMT